MVADQCWWKVELRWRSYIYFNFWVLSTKSLSHPWSMCPTHFINILTRVLKHVLIWDLSQNCMKITTYQHFQTRWITVTNVLCVWCRGFLLMWVVRYDRTLTQIAIPLQKCGGRLSTWPTMSVVAYHVHHMVSSLPHITVAIHKMTPNCATLSPQTRWQWQEMVVMTVNESISR